MPGNTVPLIDFAYLHIDLLAFIAGNRQFDLVLSLNNPYAVSFSLLNGTFFITQGSTPVATVAVELNADPWYIPANTTWLSPQAVGTITGIDADVIFKYLDKGTITLSAVGSLYVAVAEYVTALAFEQAPVLAAFISVP